MTTKKLCTLALTGALVLSAFTACQSSSDTSPSSQESDALPADQAAASDFLDVEGPAEDPGMPVEISVGSTSVESILSGYSAKEFTDDPVSDDDLELILQCGVKAPSARNLQPWRFTVIRDSRFTSSIPAATQGTVVILVSGTTEPLDGVDVSFDCGLATQSMYIAAHSLGLGAHIYASGMDGFTDSREELGLPDGYDPQVAILIGHAADPVDAVASASGRNPLEQTVNYVE